MICQEKDDVGGTHVHLVSNVNTYRVATVGNLGSLPKYPDVPFVIVQIFRLYLSGLSRGV